MNSGLPAVNYKMSPYAKEGGAVSAQAVVSLFTVCAEAPGFVFWTASLQSVLPLFRLGCLLKFPNYN